MKDGYYNACKSCLAESDRAWRARNKGKIAEMNLAYRTKNKTAIAEKNRAYQNTGSCVECSSPCYFTADRCHACFKPQQLKGADSTKWRDNNITYSTAHKRVRALHGSASAHSCVDCNGKAGQWSYIHGCPNEKSELQPSGSLLPYSPDPSYYEARCVPCHKAFDVEVV